MNTGSRGDREKREKIKSERRDIGEIKLKNEKKQKNSEIDYIIQEDKNQQQQELMERI